MKKAKHINEQPLTVEQKKKAKARRNAIGWTVFLILLAAVVAALVLLPRMMNRPVEEEMDVQTFEAAPAAIGSAIRAAGTLLDEEAEEVVIPSGVELEFAVKAGDYVEAGDLIATVDETSVMLTIAEIQAAMDELDTEIAEAMDGESATTVVAPAEARVKEIYARSGDAVADVMYAHGALMRLSLDGKMAVDIDAALVSAGQSVDVTLSDGTVKSGRVAAVTGNVAAVTITDNGPDLSDVVTVHDSDGNYLGGGELYIHSELKITGYYGEADEIFVEEEELVEIDDELMSFSVTDTSAAYAALLAERQQLEEQIRDLFQIYRQGGVYAPRQGYVAELGSTDTQQQDQQQQQQQQQFPGFMPMSFVTETVTALGDLLEAMPGDAQPENTETPENPQPPENTETPGDGEKPVIPDLPEIPVLPDEGGDATGEPGGGGTGTEEDSESGDASGEPEDGTENGTENGDASGEPDDDASGEPDTAGGGFRDVYARVESVADGTIVLQLSETEDYIHYGDAAGLSSLTYTKAHSLFYTDPAQDSEADRTTVFFYVNGAWSMGDMSGITAGAHLVLTYAGGESGETLMWIVSHQSAPAGGTDSDSSASGEMTGTTTPTTGAMPNTGMTQQQQQQSYTLSEFTVCSITPDTDMTVEIAIDEMDVLDVYEGQAVTLYLNALDETVTGEITELAEEAVNNGGNAKYTAVVTIDRTASMRTGMNAAVTVDLGEREAGCVIPVEALAEVDGKTCVYTVYDAKNEALTGLVEVTCGVSDGDMVEITSGISQGVTVYYEYTETDSVLFV